MHPVVSLVPTTFQQIESCERSCRLTTHLYPAGKQETKRAGAKVAVDKHDLSCFASKLPEIWPTRMPPWYCCRGSSPSFLSVAGWSMHPVVSLVPTTFQQIESCERSCRLTTHLDPAGKQETKRAGAKVAVDKHDYSISFNQNKMRCDLPYDFLLFSTSGGDMGIGSGTMGRLEDLGSFLNRSKWK